MNPDDELDAAEETALAATFATAKALIELLVMIRPIVERRAQSDVRFSFLSVVVRAALIARAGTPVAIREALAELGGEK